MDIVSVNEENKERVINFLKEFSMINDINKEVIMNGEFVLEEQIIGLLSFEEFNQMGLIRYFIFRKAVSEDIALELFNKIITKAQKKNLKSLLTLVVKKEAIDIFKKLGFYEIDKKTVYIEETNIEETKFKDAFVMKYDIIKN
jgi:N-acetylglutamate synthase-like GNAT family acetyltransferase